MNSDLPLLPRHGVRLRAFDTDQGERFAAVFAATWRRLPLYARRSLLRHWRAPDDLCFALVGHQSPRFEIVPFLSRCDDPDALGLCRFKGHKFQFQADAVALLPDEHLATLIAHELCHGYMFSVERLAADADSEDFVREINGIEWDFDEGALDEYMDELSERNPKVSPPACQSDDRDEVPADLRLGQTSRERERE